MTVTGVRIHRARRNEYSRLGTVELSLPCSDLLYGNLFLKKQIPFQ